MLRGPQNRPLQDWPAFTVAFCTYYYSPYWRDVFEKSVVSNVNHEPNEQDNSDSVARSSNDFEQKLGDNLTSSDIACLSLLEKVLISLEQKFLADAEMPELNPILKKRFINNISERQWRDCLLKDAFYTTSMREDMWSLHESKAFFIKWLGEMQKVITCLLSQNLTSTRTSSTIVSTAPKLSICF